MNRKDRRRASKRERRKAKEFITRHHLIPASRGGQKTEENLLRLKWYKHHEQWHRLFGNMTLMEIICCLQRIARMKRRAG